MIAEANGESACWRTIGVHGDGSCAELAQYVHCRNCPVHAQAGRRLLDRTPPVGYQESLAESMAAEPAPPARGTRAVLVFRIGEEWLAIDTPVIREVVSQRPGHSLPHHPEPAVDGLVNVRGTLEIAVSLQKLMGLDPAAPLTTGGDSGQRAVLSRTLVLSRQGETFACPVDEVAGIIALAPDDIGAVPVTVARAENRHVEGVIATERGPAGLIDPAKLFGELASRVFR
ncbi:MAG: purine-binding chemotaxis protein CheW [Gammaproteobacteria bacterium]|nr:purine-binding chemotaxis protein CheW [Gammaproteobacteria bacterium]